MAEIPAHDHDHDHDHELEVLEDDQTVPPRPEEQIADARDEVPASHPPGGATSP